MNYLSLQIDGQWAYLAEGTEIALEGNNPIFSDAGSKTYLFQLHVDSNRHLFGNADDIYGESYYKAIDGKRATLYVAGIPIMTGKVALEDEVYMDDDGCIAINIVSGNLEFAQMIEGMNCRDVELLDEEVPVGIGIDKMIISASASNGDTTYNKTFEMDFPDDMIVFEEGYSSNVFHAYPEAKFCNIRVCCAYNSDSDFDSLDLANLRDKLDVKTDDKNVYEIFGAGRRSSGINFYVLFFLDCLWRKLKIHYIDGISHVEDMTRLAMVNLGCKVKRVPLRNVWDIQDPWRKYVENLSEIGPEHSAYKQYGFAYEYALSTAFATSENFPDVEVPDVVASLENAFGVRFLYDENQGVVRSVFLCDILKDGSVMDLQAEVQEATKVENRASGFRLTYNASEDDTSYNYTDYSNVEIADSYSGVIGNVSAHQRKCFLDKRTGNAYRVIVDEDATKESELKPSVVEVGAFADALYGDCSDENKVEKIEIPFTPIINNDVSYSASVSRSSRRQSSDDEIQNEYALFVDEEVEAPKLTTVTLEVNLLNTSGNRAYIPVDFKYRYVSYLGEDFSSAVLSQSRKQVRRGESKDMLSLTESNIINSHDVGLMLGIMRGPGNKAGVEYFDSNFDGEGNSRVAFTSANYAFTSDSVDNCNRDFDYNGTGEGGVDYDGRFSLKLRAGKFDKDGNPITGPNGEAIPDNADRATRGLYDKFWKEYAYFTVNKKILRLTCRMEIADIMAIDWTKRCRIGDYVGFVASYSYSVSTTGMSDVEIELYYI